MNTETFSKTIEDRMESAEFTEWLKKKHPGVPVPNQKFRRNELCPCGSGKKYKRCCRSK